jgi:hypothetical protein
VIPDIGEIRRIVDHSKTDLSRSLRPPMYYGHHDAETWRVGAKFALDLFAQSIEHTAQEMIYEAQAKEDADAVADPDYDPIDHLIYRAERHGIDRDGVLRLCEDLKRLRTAEKKANAHRPKVDPTRQVVVYTGNHTPTHSLNVIDPTETP